MFSYTCIIQLLHSSECVETVGEIGGRYHGPRGGYWTDQTETQPLSKFWHSDIVPRKTIESFLTKEVGVVFTFSPLLITSLNSLNTNKSCFHNYKASFSLKKSRICHLLHFLHRNSRNLFDLILYVPLTIFQLNRERSSWVEPVLS